MAFLFFKLGFYRQFAAFALCLAALISSVSAQSTTSTASPTRTLPSLFESSQLLPLSQGLEYIAAPLGSIKSPDDLATNPSLYRFLPLTQDMALPTSADREVWLRFSVAPTIEPETWYFRIPKQTLEKATFYFKSTSVSQQLKAEAAENASTHPWLMLSAGLSIPNTQWPVRTRDPFFEITTRADAPQHYYVKLQHNGPITESMQLIAAHDFADGANRVGTLNGLMMGLFSALFLVSLISGRLNHDSQFKWFALLVFSMLMTQLTLSGYMAIRVWPGSTYLARTSLWVIPLLSLAVLAQYCLSISYAKELSPWIYRILLSVLILSLLSAAALASGLVPFQRSLFNLYYGAAMLTIVACMAWIAWRSQHWLWMVVISLIPLSLSILARIAYNFGLVAHVELAQLAGVISACLGLLIIYSCMVMQSRGKLSTTVREEAIETRDVATGLFNERIALARLPQVILRSRRFERSCGVLLVRWTDFSRAMQTSPNATARTRLLAHLGSRLTRVARDIDTVARVTDDCFVILVEAPVSREMLSEMASKVLTGCLRPSQYMLEQRGFEVHIAIWESDKVTADAKQVMEMLMTRINQMRDGTQRRVQFIDSPLSTAPGIESVDPQKHAQELVAKINSLEASHGLPTIALPSRSPSDAAVTATVTPNT